MSARFSAFAAGDVLSHGGQLCALYRPLIRDR